MTPNERWLTSIRNAKQPPKKMKNLTSNWNKEILVSNCSAVVDLWQNEECIYVSVERKSYSLIQKEIFFCLKSGFGRWGQVYGFVNGKSDKIWQPERGKAGAAPCTSKQYWDRAHIPSKHMHTEHTCTPHGYGPGHTDLPTQ